MKETKRKCRWKANGKVYKKGPGGTIGTTEQFIDIKEEPRSVSMKVPGTIDNGEPYGIAVDAKLAIALIAAFHNSLPDIAKEYFIKGEDHGFVDKTQEELWETCKKLVDMLRKSAGITIDKNIILKTISQPLCEGVRFYLCKKSGSGGRSYLSLVTVGVDKDGKDLHYTPLKQSVSKKFADIKTESGTGEYAHPPGSSDAKNINEVYGPEYVLLNHAVAFGSKIL